MDIQKGDFVCMWKTGIPEWWCEVIQVFPLREVLVDGVKDHEYQVRFWNKKKNQWDYFHLAPHTAHRGMVKETLRLDPSVADIFRQTKMKEYI